MYKKLGLYFSYVYCTSESDCWQIKLADEVRKHRILYDFNLADYKNNEIRRIEWEAVSKAVQWDGMYND